MTDSAFPSPADSSANVTPPTGGAGDPGLEGRKWSTIMYVSSLFGYVGFGIGSILIPLIIWLLKKDEEPFLLASGKRLLNWQISLVIYGMPCLLLTLILIGWPLLFLLLILDVVFTIIGAMKANKGELYNIPLAIPFFR